MRIWRVRDGENDAAVHAAASVIREGGIVAVPTETFYGLAADLRHPRALARVQRLKGGRARKPLLLLVRGVEDLPALVAEAPEGFEELVHAFWPGALTVALPARAELPETVLSARGGVAVRCSSDPVLRRLLDAVGGPVSGTSANRGAAPPVRRPEAIDVPGLDGVLDAGETPGGQPSTLLELGDRGARILREGAVGRTALAEILGERLL